MYLKCIDRFAKLTRSGKFDNLDLDCDKPKKALHTQSARFSAVAASAVTKQSSFAHITATFCDTKCFNEFLAPELLYNPGNQLSGIAITLFGEIDNK